MRTLTLDEICAVRDMLTRLKREQQPTPTAPSPQRTACGHCGGRVSLFGKTCPECGSRGYFEMIAAGRDNRP